MKKIYVILAIFLMTGCAEMQQVLTTVASDYVSGNTGGSSINIAGGLKEALNNGIAKQVTLLTRTDGFYNNSLVRISIPDELKVVEQALRNIGLGSLADKGIKALNTAASDAVKEATPIFVSAVSSLTFSDAKAILMGSQDAATQYLQRTTSQALYQKFFPVVKNSFSKVGADEIWREIINKYNAIPLVNPVNPDLNDYVTNKALEGVFKMIAIEEKNIRTDINARTSTLLKEVFALQDK
ncbi:MAG TPA: DUF4197 domain-containing protein [Bacteroidales bacterium]|nr:DUF4197 domain-containing protein [Bacteroidales bacterium]HOH22300.1 DUF4197 domain-containing protein [Bacteroidales bacterium]HPB57133.1 DUF4197 domain-containing protein [Bacteroidales bacterium]HPZ03232.1 DUF4197 domain-containing protein [Bacteroidales bacterium]HQB74616.1 DUF4197 domain-containing protein [Bacteroidales bacterium]